MIKELYTKKNIIGLVEKQYNRKILQLKQNIVGLKQRNYLVEKLDYYIIENFIVKELQLRNCLNFIRRYNKNKVMRNKWYIY